MILGPGLAFALPRSSAQRVPTPRELKAEAIRLQPLTGLSKRECARKFKRGWSTVKGWLAPLAQDRTPPKRFVEWLRVQAQAQDLLAAARKIEAAL